MCQFFLENPFLTISYALLGVLISILVWKIEGVAEHYDEELKWVNRVLLYLFLAIMGLIVVHYTFFYA